VRGRGIMGREISLVISLVNAVGRRLNCEASAHPPERAHAHIADCRLPVLKLRKSLLMMSIYGYG